MAPCSAVYSKLAPSAALKRLKKLPRSSGGVSSLGSALNRNTETAYGRHQEGHDQPGQPDHHVQRFSIGIAQLAEHIVDPARRAP